jgi:hypothetical protein
MSLPLRKDQPELGEDLTTADLAQGKRPAAANRIGDERNVDQINPDPLEKAGPQEVQSNPELRSRDLRPNQELLSSDERPKPVLAARPGQSAQAANSDARNASDAAPLFPNNELDELRSRWNSVQGAFVDEPRRAVEQADGLVASAMKRLAEVFAQERSNLEQQWDRGDNVSTEDLRIALQRYRSFFQRLLSI